MEFPRLRPSGYNVVPKNGFRFQKPLGSKRGDFAVNHVSFREGGVLFYCNNEFLEAMIPASLFSYLFVLH